MAGKISKLIFLCGLAVALFVLEPSHAKADTITFDDLNVPNNGAQQIARDRYRSQGVLITGLDTAPFIVQSSSATSLPNFLFGGITPLNFSVGIFANFVIPGTNTTAATNSVSFNVIAVGDTQNALWQAFFFNSGSLTHELHGTGNATVNFSTINNGITGFWLIYHNFDFNARRPFTGRIGLDNLTYNTPLGEPVPEPTTLLLLSMGLAGMGAMIRKRGKANDG